MLTHAPAAATYAQQVAVVLSEVYICKLNSVSSTVVEKATAYILCIYCRYSMVLSAAEQKPLICINLNIVYCIP